MKNVIMLLTNGFDPDVRVYKEAKYLVDNGCNVVILCWDRDLSKGYKEYEKIDGISLIRFKIPSQYGTGKKQIPAYIKFMRKCHKYIKNNSCDYLHCNDLDGALIGFLMRKKGVKKIFDMHEFYERGNAVSNMIIRIMVKTIISRFYAALYENDAYLGNAYKSIHKKLFPLRNYPDSRLIECLEKTKSEIFRIGYHGVVRGQLAEFTALFEAVKDLPNVRVDINGGGMDLDELRKIQTKYTNVFIHGPYNGIKESSKLYQNTDLLFCAYSPEDPNYQGDAEVIKFYEAIFTGTPILVTKNIGMESKVLNKGFGLSCDTRSKEDINNTIMKFVNNKIFWNECHNNEIKEAPNYSWQTAVTVLNGIYSLEGGSGDDK